MTKRNKVSRTFRNTPGENRKFARWAEELEKEGYRSADMAALPLRKGETLLSPTRWKYTFERWVENGG